MEKLRLRHAALKDGKRGTDIGEAPLHGDFLIPIKLFFSGLRCGIHEDGCFGTVQAEADHSAAAARIGLVDGVVWRALRWRGIIARRCGRSKRGGF